MIFGMFRSVRPRISLLSLLWYRYGDEWTMSENLILNVVPEKKITHAQI